MMVGCTVCDNVVSVLSDLTDQQRSHYVCPACVERSGLFMMKDSGTWPGWPFLPLKKSVKGFPECGFLVDDGGPVTYLGNVFELKSGPMKDVVAGIPTKEYGSFEAIVEDGWVVD